MVKYNISTLPVVSESGNLEGILSKYDIVELIASLKERDMVYTQIAGMDQEDKFALESIEREISASLQKIAKISKPTMFTMHVTKYHAQGVNFKYSLNGRMMVGDKTLVAICGRLGYCQGHPGSYGKIRKDGYWTERRKVRPSQENKEYWTLVKSNTPFIYLFNIA